MYVWVRYMLGKLSFHFFNLLQSVVIVGSDYFFILKLEILLGKCVGPQRLLLKRKSSLLIDYFEKHEVSLGA